MIRESLLSTLRSHDGPFDIAIIGGEAFWRGRSRNGGRGARAL